MPDGSVKSWASLIILYKGYVVSLDPLISYCFLLSILVGSPDFMAGSPLDPPRIPTRIPFIHACKKMQQIMKNSASPQHVNMWTSQHVNMWPCERVNVWACQHVNMQAWKMSACERASMCACEHASTWPCASVTMWTCGHVEMRTCSSMRTWEHVKCKQEIMWACEHANVCDSF